MGNYMQMGSGPGHYFARPKENRSANRRMFDFLQELSQRWGRDNASHPFGLGDISKQGAESKPYEGHRTHIYGACVDIFIIGTAERANSVATEQVFDEQRITYASEGQYDLERTTALVDLILELEAKWPFIQFIYDDVRVRPEYRLREWAKSVVSATTATAAVALTPGAVTPGSAARVFTPPPAPPPVRPPAPKGARRRSQIISVKQPKHADHIHLHLL